MGLCGFLYFTHHTFEWCKFLNLLLGALSGFGFYVGLWFWRRPMTRRPLCKQGPLEQPATMLAARLVPHCQFTAGHFYDQPLKKGYELVFSMCQWSVNWIMRNPVLEGLFIPRNMLRSPHILTGKHNSMGDFQGPSKKRFLRFSLDIRISSYLY